MQRHRARRLALAAIVLVAVGLAAGAAVRADGPDHTQADVGFLRDMIDHHDQANLLSSIALRGDTAAPVRNLALDVIAAQRYEIGLMDGWLMQWDRDRGAPDRVAMAWMGMPVAPDAMPGMATAEEVAALGRLTGSALDVRFLELLRRHHEGGIHMAEAAIEHARNPHVRWAAGQMARNQRREIRDIDTLLAD